VTRVGFFGLPGSGKSTIFTALTRQAVGPQFLGYDLKPHQAVVKIPDPRLERVAELFKARTIVHNTMEFMDIPGFDPTTTERKLKNAVLEHYRRCDALALTVNLYDNNIAEHAASGMRAVLDELVVLGLITAEACAARLSKAAAMKADDEIVARYKALCKAKEQLEQGIPARRMDLEPRERKLLREYAFISEIPVIVVFNISENDIAEPDAKIPGMEQAINVARVEELSTVSIAASLEAELAGMTDAEASEYMAEFGIDEPALPRFIRAAFHSLGLFTFFTGSDKECRAWSLKAGSNAQSAARVIHSDMARGFIRAETVSYDDYVQYGGLAAAKAAGKVRLEGKEYVVSDGDVMTIRFNV
jgi:GTP-binding protein YchF